MAVPSYVIHAGDKLGVLVWNQDKLSVKVLVRPDGVITLPLVGDVQVGGLTADGAAKAIAQRLDGLVVEPRVTVDLVSTRPASYSVIGEVNNEGPFPLSVGDGVLNAIAAAGGLNDFANPDEIYVVRQEPQPVRIRFSFDKLVEAVGQGLRFRLRDGDIVVVR